MTMQGSRVRVKTHIVRGYVDVQACSYQEAAFKAMTSVPGFRLIDFSSEEKRSDDKLHKN